MTEFLFPGIATAIAGLVLLLTSVRQLRRALESRAWPTVNGRVVDKKVRPGTVTAQERIPVASAVVSFYYEVNGHPYTSSTFDFGGRAGRNMGGDVYESHWFGKRVTVHYDPRDPRRAVIKPGPTAWNYAAALIGLGFLVLGVALMTIR